MSLKSGAVESWIGSRVSEHASTASSSSATTLYIPDSTIRCMRTVIPVAKQPAYLSETSACRSCGTARGIRRCVRRWSHMCSLADAVAVSKEVRRQGAHTVTNRYPLNLRPPILKVMHGALGVGNEIGVGSTASSSRTNGLPTTSDR